METKKILLVDDHALMREGVASMLKNIESVKVVGTAESGEEAINMVEELAPDIVLMDILMKGMTGIEAARWIKEQNPSIKIVLLSMEVNHEYVSLGIKVGIDGYLPKDVTKQTLVEAIQAVSKGQKFFDNSVTNLVFENFYMQESGQNESKIQEIKELTTRELEVLEQVAIGKSNQEVADSLFISIKTVETHKSNIMSKLGLRNTAELVKYAIKNNIIQI